MSTQRPRYKQQQPLDLLQSMINGVLLETGKALHAANKRGPNTLAHRDVRLQAFIPSAVDHFHSALDQIESDIVRARAVINRDLQQIRAKQQELDRPKADQKVVEDIQSAQKEQDETSAAVTATSVQAGDIEAQPSDIEGNSEQLDAVVDLDIQPPPQPKVEEIEPELKVDIVPLPKPVSPEDRPHSQDQTHITTLESATVTKDSQVESISDVPTPQPGTEVDLDFESMFGLEPSSSTNLDSDVNMNLDSSIATDTATNDNTNKADNSNNIPNLSFDEMLVEAGTQNMDFGADGDLDLSNFGETNNSNEDVTAMLESLEGFTNTSGNEFNMMDMTDESHGNNNDHTNDNSIPQNASQQQTLAADDSAVGFHIDENTNLDMTSAFDDLLDLDGIDFGEGSDDGARGLDSMEHGEFDDAFFGME